MIECLKSISELSETNNVSLIWVPGHQYIEGNKNADELARMGSETSYGPEPLLGLAHAIQQTIIRNYFTRRHKYMEIFKYVQTQQGNNQLS